ncbi:MULTISPECIES: DUF3558 domain-containing protein [unclassified Streptomyces]|uniref:DUF3558 domain-containing protein n=1 Tax=unclassified Streptomyces TaxID=2593676 RepID=UPI0019097E70|nr:MULTISPECIES: DUF3558 domain-containing protein [unclassified Streptomyces]MBK3569834.1 DUF3558 domain-containing protein [Streptomyces sp. MBT62]MBK6013494.1 DUF3558 domain-containing protein [Streptomyces sp. MBT53]
MQRKAYVPGAAALLLALLAGCTSGSGDGGTTDDANPGDAGTATAVAQPGKYRTLPEPCGAVGQSTLDSLLPGIKQITDADQRAAAYAGEATLTFDTDRKVGCRWKVESTDATDHLLVDFERVVSYDNAVSDDSEAKTIFATKEVAADLPEPAASTGAASDSASPSTSDSATPSTTPTSSSSASSASSSVSPSASTTPTALQPRTLSDLGDEAFLDDALSSSGSTAKQRTVTVVFRTSNVIVTIEYEEQAATVGVVPDSQKMQDRARKLASQLADSLNG